MITYYFRNFIILFLTVFQSLSYSKSIETAHYRLIKISDKHYRSEIGLDFFTKDSSITEGQLLSFRSRIRDCLSLASKWLVGPNDEKLEIIIVENNQSLPPFAVSKIKVSKELTRENAKHFGLNSSCPTLVHEILHIHGLVDEYPENFSTSTFKILSCRHLGAPTSIMYSPEAAFERTQMRSMDIWNYEIQGPNGNLVRNEFALKLGVVPAVEGLQKLGAINIKKVRSVERYSLVSAQQFNAIVHPGALGNELYFQCAANGTRLIFPKGSIINGVRQDPEASCFQTPAECQVPLIWSGTPERVRKNYDAN